MAHSMSTHALSLALFLMLLFFVSLSFDTAPKSNQMRAEATTFSGKACSHAQLSCKNSSRKKYGNVLVAQNLTCQNWSLKLALSDTIFNIT